MPEFREDGNPLMRGYRWTAQYPVELFSPSSAQFSTIGPTALLLASFVAEDVAGARFRAQRMAVFDGILEQVERTPGTIFCEEFTMLHAEARGAAPRLRPLSEFGGEGVLVVDEPLAGAEILWTQAFDAPRTGRQWLTGERPTVRYWIVRVTR